MLLIFVYEDYYYYYISSNLSFIYFFESTDENIVKYILYTALSVFLVLHFNNNRCTKNTTLKQRQLQWGKFNK